MAALANAVDLRSQSTNYDSNEGREKIHALVFLGSKVRNRPTLVGQQIYLD
jgi:hypothetical protein